MNGAKQSMLDTRFDLLPPRAIERLAAVLDYGAKKYGDNNWRGIPLESHLNHALRHIVLHMAKDTREDHLGHAFCRVGMALETSLVRSETFRPLKIRAKKLRSKVKLSPLLT